MPNLKLFLFGSPHLERGGESVHIARRKAAALLAYLATTRQKHSRDILTTVFWPDYDRSQGRADLSRTLSVLNKSLDPGLLAADRETVVLTPGSHLWVDVQRFRQLLADTDSHDHMVARVCERCLPLLSEAVSMYQADFLAGFTLPNCLEFDEWQLRETEALRRELALALTRLARWHAQLGDWPSAIDYARHWVELEPLREEAHGLLMKLYAQTGQRSFALRQFGKLRQVLHEELEVEPSPEVENLQERIRLGEKDLLTSSEPLAILDPTPPPFLDSGIERISGGRPAIVARERELEHLEQHFRAALEGRGRVVFVGGEAGEGKSALLGGFARRTGHNHRQSIVGVGSCHAYTGFGDPYLPFRDVLNMLTGDAQTGWAAGTLTRSQALHLWSLLPETLDVLLETGPDLIEIFVSSSDLIRRARARGGITTSRMQQLDNLTARARKGAGSLDQRRLFEQYTQVLRTLANRWPLLMLLDDLQWADAASINLLFHIGRRLAESRILLVGTYRPSELELGRPARAEGGLGGGHPLKPVVHELVRQHGDIQINLDRMAPESGRTFVDDLLDNEPNQLGDEFRVLLYERTKGHPLFTVELIQDMRERGDLTQNQDGKWVERPELVWDFLPARVEAVIEQRLGRLNPGLQEILAVASVEGETFTAQILSRILGLRERILLRQLSQQLELRHRLVRERGEVVVGDQRFSRFQFSHVLFQQYLYEGLGRGERRLLHAQIASSLEEMYGTQSDMVAARLARHYVEAGEGERAINSLIRAGDKARGLYAYRPAIDHYEQAISHLKRGADSGLTARTLMKLGLSYHMTHAFQKAAEVYEEGFNFWQQISKSEPETRPAPAPRPLRGHWSDPGTLDPALAGHIESSSLIDQLFGGLVEHGPEMDVLPGIAKNWEVLDRGRTYIFQLRQDVRWSDGTPVTAADFEFAWKRLLNPATNAPEPSALYDIRGARDFHLGNVSNSEQVGVRALDEHTLRVDLEGPTGYFLHLLTLDSTYPVPRHSVEAYGHAWSESGNIVTNGPFLLQRWRKSEEMILVRNPDYHGQHRGNLERVELSLTKDPSVPLQLYEVGDLDILSHFTLRKFPPPEQDRIRQRYANDMISAPGLYTNFIGFETSRPPFDDPRVRRAMVMATNRATLIDARRSHETPATGGFVPPGMPGHSPGIGLPYDPVKAKELLSAAGYPEGRGFPKLEMLAFQSHIPSCLSLRTQWGHNLGVHVEWKSVETSRYVKPLAEEGVHLAILAWIADYPDPVNFLGLNESIRIGQWRSQPFEMLVARARREARHEERMDLYAQADKILVDEAAIAPLTYGHKHLLIKPWVKKYPVSGLKFWFWKDVHIEPQ